MWKKTNIQSQTNQNELYEIIEEKNESKIIVLDKNKTPLNIKTISGKQINEYIQSIRVLKEKVNKLKSNEKKNKFEIINLQNKIKKLEKNKAISTIGNSSQIIMTDTNDSDEVLEYVSIDEKIVNEEGKEAEIYEC